MDKEPIRQRLGAEHRMQHEQGKHRETGGSEAAKIKDKGVCESPDKPQQPDTRLLSELVPQIVRDVG